jgi:hypothetical protein
MSQIILLAAAGYPRRECSGHANLRLYVQATGFFLFALCALSSCRGHPPKVKERTIQVFYLDETLSLKDLRVVGDVNGDEFGDVVALVQNTDSSKAELIWLSGKDQEILGTVDKFGSDPAEAIPSDKSLSTLYGGADFNHDSLADIEWLGHIIYGGSDVDSGLLSQAPIEAVSPTADKLGDVDGDGFEDAVYSDVEWDSETSHEEGPLVNKLYLISANGRVERAVGRDLGMNHAAAIIGDINGDLHPEIAVIITEYSDLAMARHVLILNGATDESSGKKADDIVFDFEVPLKGEAIEQAAIVVALGDVNSDKIPDFALADRLQKQLDLTLSSVLTVYSGYDASKLYAVETNPGEIFGDAVTSGHDYDGDGINDIVLPVKFSPDDLEHQGNDVQIRSGRDGLLLDHFEFSRDLVGGAKAGLGPVTRDSFADVAIANGESYFTVVLGRPEANGR